MACTRYLLVLSALLCLASSDPIEEVHFSIDPSKTRELLIRLIDTQWYTQTHGNLPASQLAVNMNLQQMTLQQFEKIMEVAQSNIFDLDVEAIFQTLHLKPVRLYKDFINSLEDPSLIKTAAKEVFLNDVELMFFVLYQLDANTTFYDVLKQGMLKKENVKSAMKIVGKTDEDIFELLKGPIISSFGNATLWQLQQTLIAQKQQKLIPAFMQVMNATVEGQFLSIVQNYNSSLQMHPKVLATRTSANKYLTSKSVFVTKWNDSVAGSCLKATIDGHPQINVLLEGNLTSLTTNITGNNFCKVAQLKDYSNCYYFTTTVFSLPVTITHQGNSLLYKKPDHVPFVTGAPLICQNYLVGVAQGFLNGHIVFEKTSKDFANDFESYALPPNQIPHIEAPTTTNYMVNIEFSINQSMVPNLVAHLLMNNYHLKGDASEDLTFAEISLAYHFEALRYFEYQNLLEGMKQTKKTIKKSLIKVLDTLLELKISLIETYRNFLNILDSPQTIDSALSSLKIDQNALMELMVYFPHNDTMFYNIITGGEWTQKNYEKALTVIKKTDTDIFDFLKEQVLGNLKIENFINYLNKHDGYKLMKSLVKILNVQAANFEKPEFKEMLTNFGKSIEEKPILGAVISQTEIATIGEVYNKWMENTTEEFLKLSAYRMPQKHHMILKAVPYSTGFAKLTTNETFEETISQGLNGNPKSCRYVTLEKSSPVDAKTTSKGFWIRKESLIYERGAGLVCENMLYGIAIKSGDDKIEFAGFANAKEGNGSGSAAPAIFANLLTVFVSIFLAGLFA